MPALPMESSASTREPRKTPWRLIAPDWASLDTVWRAPLPIVLWPVCEKPLLAFWLDEAVRLGVPSVEIEALDRPHLIRQWLDQRDIWSRSISVTSQPNHESRELCLTMDHLPGQKSENPPTDGLSLLKWWMNLQNQALVHRQTGAVHLDQEISPGVWIGPGAQIDPGAQFTPPCWIGSYARIGPGNQLGPRAFVGPGAFLDRDVEISDSLVCAESYVGPHTTLEYRIVQGGLLLDLERGLAVEVADPLILSSLQSDPAIPSRAERAFAICAGPILRFFARLLNPATSVIEEEFILGHNRKITLATYPTGPLLVRRAYWLQAVADGHLRLCGILPRRAEDWEALSPDIRAGLTRAAAGVLALSDLHHCHSAQDPDEWMHAVYQANPTHLEGQKQLRRNWLRLALSSPQAI